jgi:PIN domain nuclease of toxin-antitoxin system
VRALLDTHVFIWAVQADRKLSVVARRTISASECFLSLASCWEMAIKASIKKLQFDRPLPQFITEQLSASGISLLPIDFRHVMRVSHMPFHHRDPFDRLLTAQAMEESMPIISADAQLDRYGVKRFW